MLKRKISSPISNSFYVGIDCLSLPDYTTGASNYIYSLTRALLALSPEFPVAIICKKHHQHKFVPYLRPEDKLLPIDIHNRFHLLWIYDFYLPLLLKRENIRLFHATHYLCPPGRPFYRTCVTFHDAGFVLHPEYYPFLKRIYFSVRFRSFLDRAHLIFTPSHSTAADLKTTFEVTGSKFAVCYPGINHSLPPEPQKSVSLSADFSYFLIVSALERRKNVPFLIRVFERLKADYRLPMHLVIVGMPVNDARTVLKAIRQSKFRKFIHYYHCVSADQLHALYAGAEACLNASVYEGFGFTPFEALQKNRPVFLYANNVVKELLPNYDYKFSHFRRDEWAKRIAREYINNYPGFTVPRVIGQLTWERCARETIRYYESILFQEEESVAVF